MELYFFFQLRLNFRVSKDTVMVFGAIGFYFDEFKPGRLHEE